MVKWFSFDLVDHWPHLGRCIKYYDADGDGGLTEFHATLFLQLVYYWLLLYILCFGYVFGCKFWSFRMHQHPIYILSKMRLFKLPKLGPFEDHKVDAYFHELVGIPKAPSPRMASNGIEWHRMYIERCDVCIYIWDIFIHVYVHKYIIYDIIWYLYMDSYVLICLGII